MAETVDSYIAGFPPETQSVLQDIRLAIGKALPAAEETINYRIPTFRINGSSVIHFSGNNKHVGLYPVHLAAPELADEIAPYRSGKATARFPLDKPVPLKLISKIAKSLAEAHLQRKKAQAEAK